MGAKCIRIMGRCFIVAVFLLITASCGPTPTPTPTPLPTLTPTPTSTPAPTPTPAPLTAQVVSGEVEGSRLTDGTLSVQIYSQEDAQLDLNVQAEAGIVFEEPQPKGLSIDVGQDRRRISIRGISMWAFHSLNLPFPYQVDSNTSFSGEYVIRVSMTRSSVGDTKSKPPIEVRVRTFILVEGKDSVRFLPKQRDFDQLLNGKYAYLLANTRLPVLVKLDEVREPTRGMITVKVPSEQDGYEPQVTVKVLGGILFDEALSTGSDTLTRSVVISPGPIAAFGSRLLELPFQLDRNSLDGTYPIRLTVQDGQQQLEDQLPIAIGLSSSQKKPEEQWLFPREIPVSTSSPPPITGDRNEGTTAALIFACAGIGILFIVVLSNRKRHR